MAIKDFGSSVQSYSPSSPLSRSLSPSLSPSSRLLVLSADNSVLIIDVEVDAADADSVGVWTVMAIIRVSCFHSTAFR